MKKEKDFYQIIYFFDDSKFKPLKKSYNYYSMDKNLNILNENLWSMFNMKYIGKELEYIKKNSIRPFGSSVDDYAWTPFIKYSF